MTKCPSCGKHVPAEFQHCGYCGAPLPTATPATLPARERRKTVTMIFCDLKDSTALGQRIDAEALHEVKDRYFGAMAAQITRHGGKIEKYIGDAIMAVFGLPRAHEDDALRAVRAAAGMRTALARLNEDLMGRYGVALANRTGVNTGEVVVTDGPPADQRLATGDAVNVAARLEQAAPENQIYLGETTYRLVRDGIQAERVEPLELKGVTGRVSAYCLVSATEPKPVPEGNGPRRDTPIVGRDAELADLADAYRVARDGRSARLVTVIGDAGVGKTRLVHEAVERIAASACVLRGRCLAYGEGTTFWPLVGMVHEAAHIVPGDSAEAAHAKLLQFANDDALADRLASVAGLSAEPFPLHELYWAVRRFLERMADGSAVVALIEDIHWAEAAFLELLEDILDGSPNAPILLLATARHELLDRYPHWGQRASVQRIVLKPLSDPASAQVVGNLLGSAGAPDGVIERIVGAAEGNPLYVEQMLAMLLDSGALRRHEDGWTWTGGQAELTVPPTIHALLQARLDQLDPEARAAVEPASVIGVEFEHAALQALAPDPVRASIDLQLSTLEHMQIIHTVQPDGRYRFHHQLVRDTVYGGLLKRARATLHLQFVQWADRVYADRALQLEEILGHHLEQAHRYLSELAPLDDQGIAIGIDASRRLAAAGLRAFASGDRHAASRLLRRAVALRTPDDPQRVELLPDLGGALLGAGDTSAAQAVLEDLRQAAQRLGSARLDAMSRLFGMWLDLSGEGPVGEETLQAAHELVPVFEREGAYRDLASAWLLIAIVHGLRGHYQLASEAAERAIEHAKRVDNERLIANCGLILCMNALVGPTPVPEGIERCERLLAGGLRNRRVEGSVTGCLAQLRAMKGDLALARALYERSRALLRELDEHKQAASVGIDLARVELLGGDLALAERELRADCQYLESIGETYFLSTAAALLSRIVRDQGRDNEALEFSKTAEAATAPDDLESAVLWRAFRAPILARAGNLVQAEELARGALALARGTERTWLQADALMELASVLVLGKREEARRVAEEAKALYRVKGNIVAADQAAAWISRL